MFNTALQMIKKIDENPPSRQTNEFSLYKLHGPLSGFNMPDSTKPRAKRSNPSNTIRILFEVTEGIVTARVGLDWLPESLMSRDAYEKLELTEAREMSTSKFPSFFKSTKWVAGAKQTKALPPSQPNPQLTLIPNTSFLAKQHN